MGTTKQNVVTYLETYRENLTPPGLPREARRP